MHEFNSLCNLKEEFAFNLSYLATLPRIFCLILGLNLLLQS